MTAKAEPHVGSTLEALQRIFGERFGRDFSIVLWDGTRVGATQAERFVVHVRTPYALRAAFTPPLDLNPGRALAEGWLDVTGDVEEAVDAFALAAGDTSPRRLPAVARALLRLPRPPRAPAGRVARLRGRVHSRARDAAAIGFHYDQPLTFYASFLDPALVYSCAYFAHDDATLEAAQRDKIDYVLRKLRVAPGERLLDIGCGWGALVMRAAERFGAHATGITLSARQCAEARRRIAERGLDGRASVQLRDYRELDGVRFDKIVSIGMVEHVGRSRLQEYFNSAYAALRPGGLFLNHGIADQEPKRRGYRASGFIARYIFPDGELLPVSESLTAAERVGFEVRDVENLREHYARTLRCWVANLERNAEAAIAVAGKQTFRVWRLYMAASAQGFRRGRMGLFQSLLAKPDHAGRVELPPTRADLYVDGASGLKSSATEFMQ